MGRNKTDTKVNPETHQNKTRKQTDHDTDYKSTSIRKVRVNVGGVTEGCSPALGRNLDPVVCVVRGTPAGWPGLAASFFF